MMSLTEPLITKTPSYCERVMRSRIWVPFTVTSVKCTFDTLMDGSSSVPSSVPPVIRFGTPNGSTQPKLFGSLYR